MKTNYKSKLFLLKLFIVLFMFLLAAFLYVKIPQDIIPIHWGVDGTPDKFGSKVQGLYTLPIAGLLILLLMSNIHNFDPKFKNYENFKKPWEIIQIAIVSFFAYFQIIVSLAILNPEFNVSRFVILGIGLIFIVTGNYFGKLRRNWFVGIRTPWTLESDEVWNKTHRFGGYLFVLGGLISLMMAAFNIVNFYVFLFIILFVSILSLVYSYWIYKKIEK